MNNGISILGSHPTSASDQGLVLLGARSTSTTTAGSSDITTILPCAVGLERPHTRPPRSDKIKAARVGWDNWKPLPQGAWPRA